VTPEAAIRAHLRHPDYHARLSELGNAADLTADLGLCEVDRLCIGCDLEMAHNVEFPGEDVLAWRTVADVVRTLEACPC